MFIKNANTSSYTCNASLKDQDSALGRFYNRFHGVFFCLVSTSTFQNECACDTEAVMSTEDCQNSLLFWSKAVGGSVPTDEQVAKERCGATTLWEWLNVIKTISALTIATHFYIWTQDLFVVNTGRNHCTSTALSFPLFPHWQQCERQSSRRGEKAKMPLWLQQLERMIIKQSVLL